MAPRKSSQRRSARAAGGRTSRITASSFVGMWAFRFHGYAMAQERPWWLTGLGTFEIKPTGRLVGRQRSTIMPIEGQQANLEVTFWHLRGKIDLKLDAADAYNASIRFTKVTKVIADGEVLDGKFFVVAAGPERLWFQSSGATLPGYPDLPANESVQLEAVKLPEA